MRVCMVHAYGTLNTIYFFEKGEKLPWHDHKHQGVGHGHKIIAGSTYLEQECLPPKICKAGEPNLELPFDVPHQITALEDGTIFSNIAPSSKSVAEAVKALPKEERGPPVNRIRLVDGTVVHVDLDGKVIKTET